MNEPLVREPMFPPPKAPKQKPRKSRKGVFSLPWLHAMLVPKPSS
jgi:hypothetical protein